MLVTMFYSYIVSNRYVEIFMRGMQAGAVALVLNFAIGLFTGIQKKKDVFLWVLVAVSLIYIELTDFPVYYLALFCMTAAVVKTLLLKKKGGTEQ